MAKGKKVNIYTDSRYAFATIHVHGTLDGPFDVLPRTAKWPKWHPLTMTIHDPIYPTCKGEENVNRMMEESHRIIMSGLPEKYQGIVENPDQ